MQVIRNFLFVCFAISMMIFPVAKADAADVYSIVYYEVASYNGNGEQVDWISNAILYASDLYSVDPLLVTAVMEQESHFNINSGSRAGAIGVDPYNPLDNVVGGVACGRNLIIFLHGAIMALLMPLLHIIAEGKLSEIMVVFLRIPKLLIM